MTEQRNRYAGKLNIANGSMATLSLALVLILLWAAAAAAGTYLETWAFMLNGAITAITFLAVFLVQRSGKARSEAVQVEFNELKRGARYAGTRIVHVEDMNEAEIDHLHAYYQRLSDTKD